MPNNRYAQHDVPIYVHIYIYRFMFKSFDTLDTNVHYIYMILILSAHHMHISYGYVICRSDMRVSRHRPKGDVVFRPGVFGES